MTWTGLMSTFFMCTFSIGTLLGPQACAEEASGKDFPKGEWFYIEEPELKYAKDHSSQLISIRESMLHQYVAIEVKRAENDQFGFKVGCMLQNPIPLLELTVNSLDIRLFDSINDFVYARFMVDDNEEFSLRGEIEGRTRIIFAPITKSQEERIVKLFQHMRQGHMLNIALLQGEQGKVRRYDVPLTGFLPFADRIESHCQSFNHNYNGTQQYLPDYMSREPNGYAPANFSLKQAN